MITERQMYEPIKNKLMSLGYPSSSIKTEVTTPLGRRIDLVVYETGNPKIVVEFKSDAYLGGNDVNVGFHPAVRQGQLLAQDIKAPYFAVFNGRDLFWFDIDEERGRPRLLDYPIPSAAETNVEATHIGKDGLLRMFFALSDMGRNYVEFDQYSTQLGMIIFARLLSELGDSIFESFLKNSDFHLASEEDDLTSIYIAEKKINQEYYERAFAYLDNVQLSTIPPNIFIEAVDEFVQFSLSRVEFKLPAWISSIMVSLAQITSEDTVLDMFSNYGDGVTAFGQLHERGTIYSITSNTTSYLWDSLKRVILNLGLDNSLARDVTYQDIDIDKKYFGKLDRILVAPPFGQRLRYKNRPFRSEEFFLRIAVEWIKRGGYVIAIVPENLLFSRNQERFRNEIMEDVWLRTVISLDQYMPGAMVKTSILVLEKKSDSSRQSQILMGRVTDEQKERGFEQNLSSVALKRLEGILAVYQRHMDNLYSEDDIFTQTLGTWTILYDDLVVKSWAVNYYDPEKQVEINSEYPLKQLHELASLRKGSPLTLQENGSLLVIGPKAVRKLFIDPTKLDRTTPERLSTKPIRANTDDILIHAVGKYGGQAAVVKSDLKDLYVSRNIIIVQLYTTLVLPEYLAIALNSSVVTKQLEDRSTGSVISQFPINELKDILIPIPEMAIQESIISRVNDAQEKIIDIEQQALIVKSKLNQQQENLQDILDSIHSRGSTDA